MEKTRWLEEVYCYFVQKNRLKSIERLCMRLLIFYYVSYDYRVNKHSLRGKEDCYVKRHSIQEHYGQWL